MSSEDLSELSFSVAGDEKGAQRRAFRARIPGLAVFIPERGATCEVADVSAMGLAFKAAEGQAFTPGSLVEFDLLINKKVFIPKLCAKVMRTLDNGLVGCNFEALDRRQEVRLDKLVLEVQKRMIALRKKQQSQ
ncbi:PilZ domain-containing protein [Desulfocurvus sp.]|jgi:hypothetical protein|uniref:PilZ domain-containing protein n=1 Tax=Desulfocurvus sp. TaxID=2871698 RepID=UPI0025BD47B9|nr:PilZ domain-containing protein [Desulfocurvus sp.]MCK9240657.1 PilZ domain-containing protein [Desulfocurvus sp.]